MPRKKLIPKPNLKNLKVPTPPVPQKVERVAGIVPIIPGRSRKLDKNLIKLLCLHLKKGSFLETAASAVGVLRVTLRTWLMKGNEILQMIEDGIEVTSDQMLYAELVQHVHQATAEAELNDLTILDAAGKIDWKATAWKMSRRWKSWAGQEKTINHKHEGEIDHKHTHTVELDPEKLPLEVCEKIIEALKAQGENTIFLPANPVKEEENDEDS